MGNCWRFGRIHIHFHGWLPSEAWALAQTGEWAYCFGPISVYRAPHAAHNPGCGNHKAFSGVST